MTKLLQFSLLKRTYVFTFRLGIFLFWLFFFILFCKLGFWQLHRAHYKKELLQNYHQRLTAEPTPLTKLAQHPINDLLQFKTVELQAQYLNHSTMFVQNQFYQDQPGYEVLTPVQIAGNQKLLLVDRGWVAQTQNLLPPPLQEVNGLQYISGYIKLLNEYQFTLGENILYPKRSPLIMQKIDIEEITRLTHRQYYPFILRLNSPKYGFIRHWTITTMSPERHTGYAVQWFAMALALLIAYLCFTMERVKNNEK
jgi:surfeit locus 1 family protein